MSRPTYDLPVVDWISIAFNKKALEQAVGVISTGEYPDGLPSDVRSDKKYFEKILSEETTKQLADDRMPLIQIINNSIDAIKSADINSGTDPSINIKVKRKRFVCEDTGIGMGLEDVLQFLTVPFGTNKNRMEHFGRHGVGLIASFNYCLQNPKSTIVNVETSNGKIAHEVNFYSTENDVSGLRMRITPLKRAGSRGTRVTITDRVFDKKELRDYIRRQVGTVPSAVARIKYNGEHINSDAKNPWYTSDFQVTHKGNVSNQRVGVQINNSGSILLTYQGVKVKEFNNQESGMKIVFPAAVRIVEGWDEFKNDKVYQQAVREVFVALGKYITAHKDNEFIVQETASMLPSLASALGIESLKDIPNIDMITDTILSGKEYVLSDDTYDSMAKFLGPAFTQKAFSVQTPQLVYWQALFKERSAASRDFIEDYVKGVVSRESSLRKKELLIEKFPLMNIVLSRKFPEAAIKVVMLPESGKELSYYDRSGSSLYLNMAHPLVAGERTPAKAYAFMGELLESEMMQKAWDANKGRDRERYQIHNMRLIARMEKLSHPKII